MSWMDILYRLGSHLKKEQVLLGYYWKHISLSLFFNYVHSVGHNQAYMLHIPKEPFADLGFSLLPAMSTYMQISSEIAFFIILISVILFILSPLWHDNMDVFAKNDASRVLDGVTCSVTDDDDCSTTVWTLPSAPPTYTVQMLARFLCVLMIAQSLRTTSFLLTSQPGPNYHCRPFSPHYDPPTKLQELFFRQDAFFSCGDLVFSSHTTFMLLCALTYSKYGSNTMLKRILWFIVIFFGLLVASARKHYTVDITMAFYTVPLIWIVFDHVCPDTLPIALLELERLNTRGGSSIAYKQVDTGDNTDAELNADDSETETV